MIPLNDNVILRPEPPDGVTDFGLILPHLAQEPPQRGTVLAVGPEVDDQVQPGVSVLYSRYGITKFDHGDEELFLVSEENLFAVCL